MRQSRRWTAFAWYTTEHRSVAEKTCAPAVPIIRRKVRSALLLGIAALTDLALAQAPPSTAPERPPAAFAGQDLVITVGKDVTFWSESASPERSIVECSWDFDGDGTIDVVVPPGTVVTHKFTTVGEYRSTLTVRDSAGQIARAARRIVVTAEQVTPAEARALLRPPRAMQARSADGVCQRYALLINGAGEDRFWIDIQLGYDMLTTTYGWAAEDVYVLNYAGTDPQGSSNPIIDRAARRSDVEAVLQELAGCVDADDEVFVLITDHGRGYQGPLSQSGAYLGYLDGRASVDPGDEADFAESSFQLRSLFTGGDYRCNHGLNVWKVRRAYVSSTKTNFYRNRYVSHLEDVYIEGSGNVTDDDVYIERLVDYALGDTNRDGYIDTAAGEVFDHDGDGIAPYNSATGAFDEDDWGAIDSLEDDFNNCNTLMPVNGYPYRIFDEGFQGKLCIDLAYTGGDLHVDGRDEDNAGLFDWMDVNQDGDTDDIVSVDEAVCIYGDDLYDDDLRDLLSTIQPAKLTIMAETCFSGGLVEDLTASSRVIAAATIEDAVSWGNTFIRAFVAALAWVNEQGTSVNADADENGYVSILEAFNYAADHDMNDEIPQYDDNGDGLSHTDPVPAGGDGVFGSGAYLGPTPPVLHHFTWEPLPLPFFAGSHYAAQVTARDSLGALVDSFDGGVDLTAWLDGAGLATIGTGTSTWIYPLSSSYHDARTQVLYLASELGNVPALIGSLALDVTTVPGQSLTHWTIRMKHTALAAFSSAAWDVSGWTVVYQNDEQIGATGWHTFTLTAPFLYDGTDNLMVDFSFNNSSSATDGYCRCSTPGGNRSLPYRCSGQYGDPLSWSGSSPAGTLRTTVPNLKLEMGTAVAVAPTTLGPFVNGTWSGLVQVLQPGVAIALTARESNDHFGSTGTFQARHASDWDGDGDVDFSDYETLLLCTTGPALAYDPNAPSPGRSLPADALGVIPTDLDRDYDVDLSDFGIFQRCYSGSDITADPACASSARVARR